MPRSLLPRSLQAEGCLSYGDAKSRWRKYASKAKGGTATRKGRCVPNPNISHQASQSLEDWLFPRKELSLNNHACVCVCALMKLQIHSCCHGSLRGWLETLHTASQPQGGTWRADLHIVPVLIVASPLRAVCACVVGVWCAVCVV